VPQLPAETRDERISRLVAERFEEHKAETRAAFPPRSRRRKPAGKKRRQRSSRSKARGLRQGESHSSSLGTLGDLFSLDSSPASR
jgi:hypothetical protein